MEGVWLTGWGEALLGASENKELNMSQLWTLATKVVNNTVGYENKSPGYEVSLIGLWFPGYFFKPFL